MPMEKDRIVLFVAALIENHGRYLIVRRPGSEEWTLPGGPIAFGESMVDSLCAHARSATGSQILVQPSDKDVAQTIRPERGEHRVTICFRAVLKSTIAQDDRPSTIAYVGKNALAGNTIRLAFEHRTFLERALQGR